MVPYWPIFSMNELLPLKAGIVVIDLQEMFGAFWADEELYKQIKRQKRKCLVKSFL
jgi:hypothetical protein